MAGRQQSSTRTVGSGVGLSVTRVEDIINVTFHSTSVILDIPMDTVEMSSCRTYCLFFLLVRSILSDPSHTNQGEWYLVTYLDLDVTVNYTD